MDTILKKEVFQLKTSGDDISSPTFNWDNAITEHLPKPEKEGLQQSQTRYLNTHNTPRL